MRGTSIISVTTCPLFAFLLYERSAKHRTSACFHRMSLNATARRLNVHNEARRVICGLLSKLRASASGDGGARKVDLCVDDWAGRCSGSWLVLGQCAGNVEPSRYQRLCLRVYVERHRGATLLGHGGRGGCQPEGCSL
jgi:hypothetical protein